GLDQPQDNPDALYATSQSGTRVADPRIPDQIKAAQGSLGISSSAKPLRIQPSVRKTEPATKQAAYVPKPVQSTASEQFPVLLCPTPIAIAVPAAIQLVTSPSLASRLWTLGSLSESRSLRASV